MVRLSPPRGAWQQCIGCPLSMCGLAAAGECMGMHGTMDGAYLRLMLRQRLWQCIFTYYLHIVCAGACWFVSMDAGSISTTAQRSWLAL
jgi:hypothetical protein